MLTLLSNVSPSFSLVESHKELGDYLSLITFLIIIIVCLSVLLYACYQGGMTLADSNIAQEEIIRTLKLEVELYKLANEAAQCACMEQQKVIADLRQQLLLKEAKKMENNPISEEWPSPPTDLKVLFQAMVESSIANAPDRDKHPERFIHGFSPNCLSYWYPAICNHVPTPKTFYVHVSDFGMVCPELHDSMDFYPIESILKPALERIGYPAFLRTGLTSGKHSWDQCCKLEFSEDIQSRLIALQYDSACKDQPFNTIVVREMLKTKPLFRCTAYSNMPVVRERRYFVKNGEILYDIPYWPEEALELGRPDLKNWRQYMPFLNSQIDGADLLAAKVAIAIQGRLENIPWSVDVLDVDGKPYVIDMAVAYQSYGWDENKAGG